MALILVIDDQDIVRFTVKRILASKGHEIVEAASGTAGLARYRERAPALVVTDLMMPDRPGGEIIAELRKLGSGVKILAMSGGMGLDRARELGADATLEKPFRADALLATVAELISRQGEEGAMRTLPAVETVINYVDPNAPIGGINDVEREKSTFTLLPYTMTVSDMRPLAASLSLDTTGFVLVERPTQVVDFYDRAQVETIYMAEIVRLIEELTGAARVLTFGAIVRNNASDAPASAHKSVHNAHIDYNLETTRAVVDRLLPEAEKPRYAGGRVMEINVWRPIVTVESSPLALCDSRTVARADLIHGPIGGNSVAGPGAAGYNLAHNPAHRWYYAPRMRPSEAYVFRLCDSDPSAPQWAAHTSFADPTSAPDAAPRQSIEVRTVALF